jgi:hypothetical protein
MMYVILIIAAVLELLIGFSVFVGAKSAIHEILAMLAVGFAMLTFGLSAIIYELRFGRIIYELLAKPKPVKSTSA